MELSLDFTLNPTFSTREKGLIVQTHYILAH
jgi:hypothetical protein